MKDKNSSGGEPVSPAHRLASLLASLRLDAGTALHRWERDQFINAGAWTDDLRNTFTAAEVAAKSIGEDLKNCHPSPYVLASKIRGLLTRLQNGLDKCEGEDWGGRIRGTITTPAKKKVSKAEREAVKTVKQITAKAWESLNDFRVIEAELRDIVLPPADVAVQRSARKSDAAPPQVLEGEWLTPPMSLSKIANRLNCGTIDKAKVILRPYSLKSINRQTWTVRLDGMPKNLRATLERQF